MRIGIISDIHGNYEALLASFDALEREGCEEYICLGDIVGYGPSPHECISFVRENNIRCILGNHDSYVIDGSDNWPIKGYARDAILWTRKNITEEDLEWLSSLPSKIERHGAAFLHASLDDELDKTWPYILDVNAAQRHFFFQKNMVCFFGHVHIPLLFLQEGNGEVDLELLRSCNLDPEEGEKFLINVGSIGQPRDSDRRSSAVVYDLDNHDVKLLRTEYDFEKTQSLILEAGLPAILSERLSAGR